MTNQISHVEFLEISPELAVKIGLNESIILKQLTILIDTYGILMDGVHWVAITYNEWQEIFPFWSTSTIKRIFTSLEKMGLIKIEQHGKHRYDRTNWYCICEHTKKEIRSSSKKQKVELEQTKNSTSKRAQPMSPELENKYQKVKRRLKELCFFPLKADQKKELQEAIVTYPLQQILVAIEETAARSIFAWKYAYKVLVTNQTHVSRKPTRQEILPDWFGKDDDTIYEFSEEQLAKKRRLEAIQAKYREAAG
ncbi:hypothetical protein [Bacillus niameyensis]|uniref:hypothetical protein n=1 Tax=Bacillus niameyensis TaxID=1522308 RepID=UPI0007858602|nr:hypothetical protein [Bacillus niameyensis]